MSIWLVRSSGFLSSTSDYAMAIKVTSMRLSQSWLRFRFSQFSLHCRSVCFLWRSIRSSRTSAAFAFWIRHSSSFSLSTVWSWSKTLWRPKQPSLLCVKPHKPTKTSSRSTQAPTISTLSARSSSACNTSINRETLWTHSKSRITWLRIHWGPIIQPKWRRALTEL